MGEGLEVLRHGSGTGVSAPLPTPSEGVSHRTDGSGLHLEGEHPDRALATELTPGTDTLPFLLLPSISGVEMR